MVAWMHGWNICIIFSAQYSSQTQYIKESIVEIAIENIQFYTKQCAPQDTLLQ